VEVIPKIRGKVKIYDIEDEKIDNKENKEVVKT